MSAPLRSSADSNEDDPELDAFLREVAFVEDVTPPAWHASPCLPVMSVELHPLELRLV